MSARDQEIARERALKVMRTLATAGGNRLNDPDVEKKLLNADFFKKYRDQIETDPEQIERDLSVSTAANRNIPASKFYPLPFERPGHYLIVLFRPHFMAPPDGCRLEIVAISCEPNCAEVGYRIERGHRGPNDEHGYLHVQFTKTFFRGGLEVSTPEDMSVTYPAYPIPDNQPFAAFYAALVAFTGLRTDWQGGVITEFQGCRDFYQGSDFDETMDSLKAVCSRLLFSQPGGLWPKIKAWLVGRWPSLTERLSLA